MILMLVKWKMITCQLGEEDDEKNKKKCSDVVTCRFWQSLWQKREDIEGKTTAVQQYTDEFYAFYLKRKTKPLTGNKLMDITMIKKGMII